MDKNTLSVPLAGRGSQPGGEGRHRACPTLCHKPTLLRCSSPHSLHLPSGISSFSSSRFQHPPFQLSRPLTTLATFPMGVFTFPLPSSILGTSRLGKFSQAADPSHAFDAICKNQTPSQCFPGLLLLFPPVPTPIALGMR